ncbi:MAG: DUF3108 domain-containing protein [Zoogloeaceae bacterium]|jgi:hypothetical protein|nr:DUF3108 domain-containing protein [Zoogloeaceae bacterium]
MATEWRPRAAPAKIRAFSVFPRLLAVFPRYSLFAAVLLSFLLHILLLEAWSGSFLKLLFEPAKPQWRMSANLSSPPRRQVETPKPKAPEPVTPKPKQEKPQPPEETVSPELPQTAKTKPAPEEAAPPDEKPAAPETPPEEYLDPEHREDDFAEIATMWNDRGIDFLREHKPANLLLPNGGELHWRGNVDYNVYRGEKSLEIGTAFFFWEFRSGYYRLALHLNTSGLISLIYPIRMDMESTGVTRPESGFHPLRYQVARNEEIREITEFQRAEQTLTIHLSGRQKQFPLRRASQDILSLYGQMLVWAHGFFSVEKDEQALLPSEIPQNWERGGSLLSPERLPLNLRVWVATGKNYEEFRVEIVGEETLSTPGGEFQTLHLRLSGRGALDFWLRPFMPPLQFRYIDREGDAYELRFVSWNAESAEEAADSEPAPELDSELALP